MKKGLCFLAAFVLWLGTAAAEDPTKGVLPSRYDMRNDGIVTPVKLQYPQMCCWAFGAVGAAETAILSAMGKTYDEYPLDLSELHAAWFAKGLKETPDDTWEQDLKDWQIQQQKNIGGGESSAVGCLYAMGAGPAEENGTWQDWSETEKAPETDPKLNESYDDIFTVYDYFCIKAFYREK